MATTSSQPKSSRQFKFDAKRKNGRNARLADPWSCVHVCSGILVGWLVSPLTGLLILALYEPLEVLVISPICARYYIDFGYEAVINSLSDIFFDAVGVTIGYFALTALINPPFHLF